MDHMDATEIIYIQNVVSQIDGESCTLWSQKLN